MRATSKKLGHSMGMWRRKRGAGLNKYKKEMK